MALEWLSFCHDDDVDTAVPASSLLGCWSKLNFFDGRGAFLWYSGLGLAAFPAPG